MSGRVSVESGRRGLDGQISQIVVVNRAKIETRLINGGKLILKLKIEINSIIFFYCKRWESNRHVLKVLAGTKNSEQFAALVAFRKGPAG